MISLQENTANTTGVSIAYPKERKIFFPNLDGLRFICFLLVFLFHAYKVLFANLIGTAAYDVVKFLFQYGELGVNFFFVLSGFLITYLLMKEIELTGSIHVKNFYIRRMLRIWPLFYLCVFIGFLMWPLVKYMIGEVSNETSNPLYYLFFLNNFDYIKQQSISNNFFPDALVLIVLWSVAVEEQFYLVWPVLLKYIPKKFYALLFAGIIVGTLVFRFVHATGHYSDMHDMAVLKFHTFSVIGDMAIGALMAYYCSYPGRFLSFIGNLKKTWIALIYLGAIAVLLFRDDLFNWSSIAIAIERLVIAIIFGLIILEQNFCKNSFFKLSTFKLISRLGMYTYGLYCLHLFVIGLIANGWYKLDMSSDNLGLAIFSSIAALYLSIVLCKFSYRYFEKPFLRLKDKFAFITK